MINAIQEYLQYLHNVKKTSRNTEISYERDLRKAEVYFKEQKITEPSQITSTNLNSYMLYLEREKLSPATVSRSIAALRSFFQYLVKEQGLRNDPTETLRPPRVEKKAPAILTVEEVDLLLRQPEEDTPKGMRDRAMLELLYATGIRVSELTGLKLADLNWQMGYITCREHDRDRMVPFGEMTRKALSRYLREGREKLLKGRESAYPVYQLQRKSHEPSGILENSEGIRFGGRDYGGYYAPHPAPFFCGPYAAERGGFKERAGNAGTFRYFHHADVSEYGDLQDPGGIQPFPSPKIGTGRQENMNYRRLGKTGLMVSEIGLGAEWLERITRRR